MLQRQVYYQHHRYGYGSGPKAHTCVRCGVIRRCQRKLNGSIYADARGEWSDDGGKTWTKTHQRCGPHPCATVLTIRASLDRREGPMKELTEKVTVTRVVPSPIKEMVLFVKALQGANVDIHSLSDEELIRRAREFWNFEHGEE